MRRNVWKIVLLIFLLAGLFRMPVYAVVTTCTMYEGNNVETQNYLCAASTMKSYLNVCDDGTLMRIQYGSEIEGLLIEYYDTSYNLLTTKMVTEELPIFGAFYESDKYYFVLTGQTNYDELPDIEVYRITKYDKNWNRLESVGLYDCNTILPFRSGSARMDTYGNYLLIRTSHQMYTASDGKNHQANVTIQVDMENMTITDSYTDVMNSRYGYVSHSFNQFIHVEDGYIRAVDHGDAYPRSIALIKYNTDVSSGTFSPSYYTRCSVVDVLLFPGAIGENTTGASIGGFEISDSAYLIAGNSVVQDEDNLARTTRNIFVASVDKSTSGVTMNWITSYEEGDGTTSTPHMIKISNDRYILLWSRNNNIYYTQIDGNGNKTDNIYNFTGNLSDCVPVVVNDKLVWYTWDDETIVFYDINLDVICTHHTTTIVNGCDYENHGVVDGYAILKCTKCGLEKQLAVATYMTVWWNETEGSGYYCSYFSKEKEIGDKLYYWVIGSPSGANEEFEVFVENPSVVSVAPGYFTMLNPGTTTITIRFKYNPSISQTYTITVNGPLTIQSFTANKNSPQQVGTKIVFSGEAEGGSGDYTYSFLMYNQRTKEWYRFHDFVASNTFIWTAGSAGTRDFYVEVKDREGTVVRSEALRVHITNPPLKISGKTNVTTVETGKKVTITGTASGGSGDYTYSYLVYNEGTGSWARLTPSFVESKTFTWTAGSIGNRKFYVEARDSEGTVIRSEALSVQVVNPPLKITGQVSSATVTKGKKITITGTASGGSGGYTYSYLVYNVDTDTWSRLTSSFVSSKTFTWTAGSVETRKFYVEVKDSEGTVVRSEAMSVEVTNPPLAVVGKVSADTVTKGEKVVITVSATGGSEAYTYYYWMYNANTEKWSRLTSSFVTDKILIWTAESAGQYEFYIDVRDSKGTMVRSNAVSVEVTNLPLTITGKVSASTIMQGGKVTITGIASGGSGGYAYSYLVYNKTTGEWARLTSAFTSPNTFIWTAGSAGIRDFYVEVKDSEGTVVRSKVVTVTVTEPELAVTAKASATSVATGTKVTITGTATGGVGGYTYSYLVYNKTTGEWARLISAFTSKNTFTWTAGSAGTRVFYVEVKDGAGEVVRSAGVNVTIK